MSEEDFDDTTDDTDGDEIAAEHTRRLQRFIALGGGIPIQQELRLLKKIENHERTSLKEAITDGHRALVSDLVAAGIPNDTIATIFGISDTYLAELFPYELSTGFDLAKANLVRSLYLQGLSGSTRAALGWLRNHNRSNWRSKTELSGSKDSPVEVEVEHKGKSAEEAKAWLGTIVSAMMGDKELRNKTPSRVPGENMKAATPKPKKARKTTRISKPREEDPDDET